MLNLLSLRDQSVDGTLLLAAGPVVCQEQHTHNSFGVRTSADFLVVFLLRSSTPCLSIPGRSLLLFLQTNRRQHLHNSVWRDQYLLCRMLPIKTIQLYLNWIIVLKGVMVRLMLVLAPVMCILSAIGISQMLNRYCKQLEPNANLIAGTTDPHIHSGNSHPHKGTFVAPPSEKKMRRLESNLVMKHEVASFFVLVATGLLLSYSYHCIWVTSEAYSSPSIVLSARSHDGSRIIFDDFREAYYWLRQNTAEDAKVMSWSVIVLLNWDWLFSTN